MESRYIDGKYLSDNPDWDRQDAPWKAAQVMSMLSKNNIEVKSICEVGCGSGDILLCLLDKMPSVRMSGFDISPQLSKFWDEHQDTRGIEFHLGDFHEINKSQYDLLLMLDVFEHLTNPFDFLEKSRAYSSYFIFHIPLDLSASSVVRGNPLMKAREKVGHLHYYTKDLALATLADTGYQVIDWFYTGASLNMPNRSLKTRIMALPRIMLYTLNKDIGVRILGGETLIVLAKVN